MKYVYGFAYSIVLVLTFAGVGQAQLGLFSCEQDGRFHERLERQ